MADATTESKDPGRPADWDEAITLTTELVADEKALRKKYDRRARIFARLEKAGASVPLIASRIHGSRVQVRRHIDRINGVKK